MKRRYRNTAFLVELMVNILVFSVSCAILVGLFGKAWQLMDQSRARSAAGNEALALVEQVKAGGLQAVPHGEVLDGGWLVCRYDEHWQPTSAEDAPYDVRLRVTDSETGAGVLRSISAVAETGERKELYLVETAVYIPNEGGVAA